MDSLSTQKAKPRKMKIIVKKSRVEVLLDMFYRVIEITVVMVTLAKLCYEIVIMFEDSGLTRFLINRHLAFILGNAIVIAIVFKCGFFVKQEPDAQRNKNDFYDEFVRESSRGERSLVTDVICKEKHSEAEKEAKQIVEDKREKQKKTDNSAKQSSGEEREKKDVSVKRQRQRQNITQVQDSTRQSYERSRSENHVSSKKSSCGRLKRSETENSADRIDSDDELRYKIESFIARQRRNQKDEEFSII